MPIEFWILLLCVAAFFAGVVAKIDFDHYKADCEREARAEERRRAYEREKEYIKAVNRRNLIVSWCEEANGGAKK